MQRMFKVPNDDFIYLKKLIDQGENMHLDFKFAINDSKKIARSLVAFANSEGGTLLIGVKDNGKIRGIRSDEEIYMVDAAANLYCKPPIIPKLRLWEPEPDKQVLEVIVAADHSKIWKAITDEGSWKAWIRVNDQSIIAGNLWEQVRKKQQSTSKKSIIFERQEQLVFSHLSIGKYYTTDEISKLTGLPLSKVDALISDFIILGLMELHVTTSGIQCSVKIKPNK